MEDLKQYECGLFADRETLGEALEYANMLAKATENPIVTLTAVHVVLNTVLRIIEEREATV